MSSTGVIIGCGLRAGVRFGVFAGVVMGLAGGWRVGIVYGLAAAVFFAVSLSGFLLWAKWRKEDGRGGVSG